MIPSHSPTLPWQGHALVEAIVNANARLRSRIYTTLIATESDHPKVANQMTLRALIICHLLSCKICTLHCSQIFFSKEIYNLLIGSHIRSHVEKV